MRCLSVYNDRHLGDCLHSIHFLNHLTQYNNIVFELSCPTQYHNELELLINDNQKIKLFGLEKTADKSICIADICAKLEESIPRLYPYCCKNEDLLEDVLKHILVGSKLFSEENNLICHFENVQDVFYDFTNMNLLQITDTFDCIIINSQVLSGQVSFTIGEQTKIVESIIKILQEKNLSFITTQKIEEHPSTTDNQLKLLHIGKLAQHSKFIIGVPTSPFWICINKKSIENRVKFLNITQDCCTFDFDDTFSTLKGSTIDIINGIESKLEIFLN